MAAGQPITDAARKARAQNLRAGNYARMAALRAAVADRVAAGKKTCSWCSVIRPLEEFYRDASHPDGHRYECISCLLGRRAELRRPGTPLPGFVTKCCDAPIINDSQLGWWWIRHKPGCRQSHWQPARVGADSGEWESPWRTPTAAQPF